MVSTFRAWLSDLERRPVTRRNRVGVWLAILTCPCHAGWLIVLTGGSALGASVELRDDAAFRYLRLEFREDVLIGATSLGHTDHVGVIRGLIQGRIRLGQWRDRLLKDPLRLADAYVACAQQAT